MIRRATYFWVSHGHRDEFDASCPSAMRQHGSLLVVPPGGLGIGERITRRQAEKVFGYGIVSNLLTNVKLGYL